MICNCYKTKPIRQTRYDPITGKPSASLKTVGYCSGTRENDLCDCCGDTAKCDFYPEKRTPKPITNYERIKNMSVEEMAEFLDDMQTDALFLEGTIHDLKYPTDWKKYLESEVQSDA